MVWILIVTTHNYYYIESTASWWPSNNKKSIRTIQKNYRWINKKNFESKCSIKIETNSKGHNTTVHLYQGVTIQEIDDTVEKAVYAHNKIQEELAILKWINIDANNVIAWI